MTLYKDNRVDDGIMRHQANSMAWKSFDELHHSFGWSLVMFDSDLLVMDFNHFGIQKPHITFGLSLVMLDWDLLGMDFNHFGIQKPRIAFVLLLLFLIIYHLGCV